MATTIRAGTSGYSYKEWRGPFYPDDLPQDQWLTYYAGQLPTVEINNTFYRMPKDHVVAAWRDAVPDGFKFVIKASRRITHQSRLKDAEEATGYLVKRARVLGDKLGAVLFQLPPYMRLDVERLQAFQSLIPEDVPSAFEFRHESWDDEDVDAALAAHGHARVVSHDEESGLQDVPSGRLVYMRLRAFNYTPAALRKWHAKVMASGADNAFVFFKHEDDGAGPAMAKSFLAIPGKAQPTRAPARRTGKAAAASKPAQPAQPAKTSAKSASRASSRKRAG